MVRVLEERWWGGAAIALMAGPVTDEAQWGRGTVVAVDTKNSTARQQGVKNEDARVTVLGQPERFQLGQGDGRLAGQI